MFGTLGVGFTSDMVEGVVAYVGKFFADLNVLILVIIGLPVAFWVIRKVISLVRVRA